MRIRSLLHYGTGLWPESRAPADQPAELTDAARAQARAAIEELTRLDINVRLDSDGRARFRATRSPSRDQQLLIERCADLIEAYLSEQCR